MLLAPELLILLHKKHPDARLTWRDCTGQPKENGKWVRVYSVVIGWDENPVRAYYHNESRSASAAVLHAYSVLA